METVLLGKVQHQLQHGRDCCPQVQPRITTNTAFLSAAPFTPPLSSGGLKNTPKPWPFIESDCEVIWALVSKFRGSFQRSGKWPFVKGDEAG